MARPIEATPTLYGKDAEALLDSLENCASEEEMQRRLEVARIYLRTVMGKAEDPVIRLTPMLASLMDELTKRMAGRFGESPEETRRLVEIAVVQRGVAAVQGEAE